MPCEQINATRSAAAAAAYPGSAATLVPPGPQRDAGLAFAADVALRTPDLIWEQIINGTSAARGRWLCLWSRNAY